MHSALPFPSAHYIQWQPGGAQDQVNLTDPNTRQVLRLSLLQWLVVGHLFNDLYLLYCHLALCNSAFVRWQVLPPNLFLFIPRCTHLSHFSGGHCPGV